MSIENYKGYPMKNKDKLKITRISVKVPGIEIPAERLDDFRRAIRNAARRFSAMEKVDVNLSYTESNK